MKRLFAIGLTFAVLSASVNLEAMPLGIRMAMCGKAVERGLELEPERDPVADAVGAAGLVFSTGGDAEWVVQTDVVHGGESALRSGKIGDLQDTWVMTEVSGAGTVSFWWKASSEHYRQYPIDYVSFSVDGEEVVRLGGNSAWTNVVVEVEGNGTHYLSWTYCKDDMITDGEDCAWLDDIVWTSIPDPIPELSASATTAEVVAALVGSVDAKLTANITDAATYAAYRTWALGLAGVTPDAVKASPNAWLSYALNTAALIAAAPKDGDVVIDTFESAANAGTFEFAVKIDGIAVGDNALEANIRKVFDIEGAEKLASGGAGFSSDNVEVNDAAPENGNVKFTVTPKAGNREWGTGNGEKPNSFFFRVKMK